MLMETGNLVNISQFYPHNIYQLWGLKISSQATALDTYLAKYVIEAVTQCPAACLPTSKCCDGVRKRN